MWDMTTADAGLPDQDRKGPGRPRSVRADEAILTAVLELLADGTTAEALSMEAVAARAGVGKATIYRRWPNKDALLLDAVASLKGPTPEITGESVRDDLIALLRPVGQKSPQAARVLPCIMTEMHRSPELRRCYQKVMEPRRERMREVFRRGIASGELRPDLDIEVTMAMLVGPLLSQAMLGWNPDFDREKLPTQLVDAIWPAIAN